METTFALVVTGLIVLALVVAVLKVVSALQRVASIVRGEPSPRPARVAIRAGHGVVLYRTRNGRADYRFRIERAGNAGYRIYILDQRDYGGRNSSQIATHRLRDSQGDYVCWTQSLETPEQARQVAAMWADKTEDYIRNGRTF